MLCLQHNIRTTRIAIRCPSCGDISHRKCDKVSHYAPHKDWCCHVCNQKIPTSNNTNHSSENLVCPACRGRLANYRAPFECSKCRRRSTSNVLHKQGLPWSIFEAPTAGPARPVFPPLTVGQPNSRTEHHRSPKTPSES